MDADKDLDVLELILIDFYGAFPMASLNGQ